MTRSKKDEGLLGDLYEMLLLSPAWLGPPLALIVFLVLRFLIPAVFGGGEETGMGTVVAGVARGISWIAAGLVLCIWLLAEFQKWRRRRLLDAQSGLNSIRDLSWQEFEHLVGEAYRRQGYVVQQTGSTGGDGGIDVVLTRGDERVLVQCKQWRTRRVGVKPVRELFGVMTSESATRGILVTYGSFTRDARSFAEGKPLALVEGPELWELVKSAKATRSSSEPEHKPTGVETEAPASTRSPRPPDEASPKCPKCNAPMALRTAKKGSKSGSQFWGCSQFPKCRGTREHPR